MVGELEPDAAPAEVACENCAAVNVGRFEVSRLIYREGELVASEVVTLLCYCERCIDGIVERDWRALARVARRPAKPDAGKGRGN